MKTLTGLAGMKKMRFSKSDVVGSMSTRHFGTGNYLMHARRPQL